MICAHPAVATAPDADRRVKAWPVEFSMTPAARTKVRAGDPEEKDQTEEFYS